MVQANNYMRLRAGQLVTQLRERLVGDATRLVPDPLGIHEGHRPALRDPHHPQGWCRTEHLPDHVSVVVIAGYEVSLLGAPGGERQRALIGLVRAVLGDVTGDDHHIDATREGGNDRRERARRVVIPQQRVGIGEQMRVAQLGEKHRASVGALDRGCAVTGTRPRGAGARAPGRRPT